MIKERSPLRFRQRCERSGLDFEDLLVAFR
jgi:hypothetical protein